MSNKSITIYPVEYYWTCADSLEIREILGNVLIPLLWWLTNRVMLIFVTKFLFISVLWWFLFLFVLMGSACRCWYTGVFVALNNLRDDLWLLIFATRTALWFLQLIVVCKILQLQSSYKILHSMKWLYHCWLYLLISSI